MNPFKRAVYQEMEDRPDDPLLKQVLADMAEERGDELEAKFWRWLLSRVLLETPIRFRRKGRKSPLMWKLQRPFEADHYASRLPPVIYNQIKDDENDYGNGHCWLCFRTLANLYEATLTTWKGLTDKERKDLK